MPWPSRGALRVPMAISERNRGDAFSGHGKATAPGLCLLISCERHTECACYNRAWSARSFHNPCVAEIQIIAHVQSFAEIDENTQSPHAGHVEVQIDRLVTAGDLAIVQLLAIASDLHICTAPAAPTLSSIPAVALNRCPLPAILNDSEVRLGIDIPFAYTVRFNR